MRNPLDARLQAVYDAVRPGAVVADVGTDHGYLVCALVEEGKCPRGFASDIRPQPLQSARIHINERGLESKIIPLLSDGLRELPGEEIDDVVMAGMGGELIGQLLTAVDWTRNPDKRFVLQPMTRASHLRRGLYREGFVLLEERVAAWGKFLYTVMTAAYKGTAGEPDELFARGGLLLGKTDPLSRAYLHRERKRLRKQAEGLRRGGDTEQSRRLLELADKLIAEDLK